MVPNAKDKIKGGYGYSRVLDKSFIIAEVLPDYVLPWKGKSRVEAACSPAATSTGGLELFLRRVDLQLPILGRVPCGLCAMSHRRWLARLLRRLHYAAGWPERRLASLPCRVTTEHLAASGRSRGILGSAKLVARVMEGYFGHTETKLTSSK